MKSFLVTILGALPLGFALASTAAAQDSTGDVETINAEGRLAGKLSELLPVPEAKKRYLEKQKNLEALSKGGWRESVEVLPAQRQTRLAIAVQSPRDRIRAAVAETFDARRQLQQAELVELENRIARIKRALEIRDAMRDTVIDQRTDELLDQMEEKGESDQRGGGSTYPGTPDGAVAPPDPDSGAAQSNARLLKLDLEEARANLKAAERAYARVSNLHASGALSQEVFDEEADKLKRAKIQWDRALVKLDALQGHAAQETSAGDNSAETGNRRLAELDVQEAEANLAAAKTKYERFKRLYDDKAIEQSLLDEQVENYKRAQIQLERAKTKLTALDRSRVGEGAADDATKTASHQGPPDKSQIVWGQNVGSLQLGWDVEPKKESYQLGDVLTFGLIIRNVDDKPIQFSMPRTQVLEKLGLDLTLLGSDGQGLRYLWGPAHKEKYNLEVSGYLASTLEPGGIQELPPMKLLVGRDKLPGRASDDPSIFAALDVKAGQTARLWFKLLPIGAASDDKKELQSEPFEFRVEEPTAKK